MAASDAPVSPVIASKPELTISPAAVNNEPVELDSTPASAEKRRRGSRATGLQEMSTEERQKREELISRRLADPAVMVDIPQTPGPQELERSGISEENADVTE
ncbi:hypothetical protein M433DRAFT_7364 [Acidomyces richmondensis BFW]|nr:MAG: hypothetical protein FE78DRAFT_30825 [Acidomyces sp. 'richmondensis']KYG42179.1 hypothetical protein M433DRAFT_7364 [Acidomyces richmondensis BFW]